MLIQGECEPLDLRSSRPAGGYKLWLNTHNATIGTHVLVTCSKAGFSHNGSVLLTCTAERRWNGSVADCYLNAHERHILDTGDDFTTEVIVIWSVGGAMIAMLAAILVAILCAKYTCKDTRRTTPEQRRVGGLHNPGFAPVHDISGPVVRGERGNVATVIPGAAPPYPGSPRSTRHPASQTHPSTPHFASPPPPYPGSLPRGTSTRIVTSSLVHVAPMRQNTATSNDRHNLAMPLPAPANQRTPSQPEILEAPPPYTRYPNGDQRRIERRSFSARSNRCLDSSIYI